MARSIGERLIWELTNIRHDLKRELRTVKDSDLDWAPTQGMKSYREQLKEIGAMQVETSITLREGRIPEWEESESHVQGETVAEIVASLDRILEPLVAFLPTADFAKTIPVPSDWEGFFGVPHLEPEELVRWIVRHEYYHLGQIVTYNWIRGHNPYKPLT